VPDFNHLEAITAPSTSPKVGLAVKREFSGFKKHKLHFPGFVFFCFNKMKIQA